MIMIASVVRSAEYVNRVCSRNWEKLSTQNYFDPKGFFVLVMICIPLLMDSFIMLIAFLREAASLLIQVKTKQIKIQMRKQSSKMNSSTAKEGDGITSKGCMKEDKLKKED
jgi:transmembrane protein 18